MSLAQLPSARHKGLVNSSLPSSVINTTDKEEQKNRRRRRNLLQMEAWQSSRAITPLMGGMGRGLPGDTPETGLWGRGG